MPKKVMLEGKRFGNLVVVKRLQSSRDGSVLWECLCDCGNIFQASTRHLNRAKNTVKSCGCRLHRSGAAHAQWTGVGNISGGWWSSHVKHSANCKGRKTLECSITKEYANQLFIEQGGKCFFTKEPLVIHNSCHNNTASIDRIDNNQGYVEGNVRWVHKVVNMMKRTYDDQYFVDWCVKIATGVCPIK